MARRAWISGRTLVLFTGTRAAPEEERREATLG
jgi:hypothetical protein